MMRKRLVFSILLVALGIIIGIISTILISNLRIDIQETFPLSFSQKTYEKASPSDFISEKQIEVYENKIIIWIKDASLDFYADTNSMDPTLDSESNGISVPMKSEEDLQVGDIIVFRNNKELIVHRIIEISEDEKGWYCVTKGDNSTVDDGVKIRFKEIISKTIGILY